jgi:hypothetical protein
MIKLIIVGAAMVATAAVAQAPQAPAGRDNLNDPVCRVVNETGSRLNRTRVCMTRAQWAAQRRETRENVERSQNVPHERQYGG